MKKISNLFLGIITCLCLVIPVFAAIDIPEKTETYVNDYMNVLSSSTIETINEKNDQLENGAEILIVTTDYINTDTEEFAYNLFNRWGVGDSSKNNGVLIVLVTEEEKYWVATGTGLDDVLSSGTLSDILYDEFEEDFDAKNYDRAVLNTFNEIWRIVGNKYGISSGEVTQGGGFFMNLVGIVVPILVIIFILLLLGIIFALPSRRGYSRSYRPRYRGYEQRRYEDPYRGGFGSPRPFSRPEPRPTTTRPSSSRTGGLGSFGSHSSSSSRGFSSGMRSSGGGRTRGGGAGRK